MKFSTYKIKHPGLARFVQYILFNYSDNADQATVITSYANNNICLGIAKEKELIGGDRNIKRFHCKGGVQSYLSGLYSLPHHFQVDGIFDEICIDFTPLGYYHFFKEPLKTYVFGENLLHELWGAEGTAFFETIFESVELKKRGSMIEKFLLSRIIEFENPFLEQCLYYMHSDKQFSLTSITKALQCSEKRISRTFQRYFDLLPKDYMKMIRFRKALWMLQKERISFTGIAHECNYYDQSHFIKEIRLFTGMTPRQLHSSLHCIEDNVLVSLQS
ncbi:helix-turn-helix domain-containing protein [Niabella sp. 22666]|uniref:helix-turn-helix domain-containing protein n=1 Tax=Niabella sp. 22666 TaxID=3453954 RepID=UPI003F85D4B5